VAQLK